MSKYQNYLTRVPGARTQAALRGIFSLFLTDDDPPKLKDLTLASIVLSGSETTQITISGACTTGLLLSSTCTTGINITGACSTAVNIARTTAKTAIRVGEWKASQAAGNAVVFATNMAGVDTSQLNIIAAFGESTSDLTSAYSTSVIRGRHLVTAATDTEITHEVYGVMGQVVCKNASFNHYASGIMGTFEASNTLTHVMSGYVAAAVTGRLGGGVLTSESGAIVAGVAAINNSSAHTATGIIAGFATHKTAAGIAWPIGLYMPVGSVTQAVRIGNWAGSGAAGSAILISGATDAADTSQRNIIACYGESTTDLTSGIHANVGRFRHLVVGSSLQVNHETYGLVGQLVGKSATLLHMHAGLMGTLESNTTALVCNGAYAYSVAAVIARVGGGALLTATKPIAGFSAIFNGAAISASGVGIAYAACATSTGTWTYLLGADKCDNLLYVATGTAYECGVKVATQLTSNAYPKADGVIRFYVGNTAYYIPFLAAGNIDNE
jgi:hypothetical protein